MNTNIVTLYKLTKTNKIQQWSIWREQDSICIEHGQKDGKKQLSTKTCTPKNVGRSNATTAEEQADLEIISLIKKQLDKGYYKSEKEALNNVKMLPMLAHKYQDYKHNIKFPCYIQPKLDGVRALFINGKLISRKGKEYNAPHLVEQLRILGQTNNIILDGEIYLHGSDLQTINSWIKKKQENTKKLEFHIYDVFFVESADTFEDRTIFLSVVERHIESKNLLNIKIVKTLECKNESDIYKYHAEFLQDGYEGSIIRDASLLYEINRRSNKLLKLKDFQDEEFEIIGYKEGVGKFKGCVIWRCKTLENKEFDVVPKGTLELKKEFFQNADNYIGKHLTVQFFDKTQDNIPRFPVGITIREDI